MRRKLRRPSRRASTPTSSPSAAYGRWSSVWRTTIPANGNRKTSPAEWRFDHYGTVLVEAELRGHEPVQREHRLKKPLYQQPVLDFVTDVLYPGTIRDDHELHLVLAPLPERTEEDVAREVKELEAAANAMREGARGPR